ncbi:chloride channel protein [Roseibium aggregatum]|uniref:Chloride channel protein n=1 Tax=Roseibium aggregatum TaxID=187304 RepID=A0A926P564_9HYPH|nr:chloride channel protein [Roseibium aggregatum]MBD1547427.1 chloride channel protein [Roseibium aggregatum]
MPEWLLSVIRRLGLIRTGLNSIPAGIRLNFNEFLAQKRPIIWLLALCIGAIVSWAAILFREAIGLVQLVWLGTSSENVITALADLPWYVVVAAPTVGGLIVGLLLQYVQPTKRTYSVADVIEARARGVEELMFRPGILSALITTLSLGSGASAGREGPVVHLGATIGASLSRLFQLPASARRILLACGVASAVSASFNAPIAGVLFAHEVILGHYALSAISPIAISAVTGTVFSRLWFGDVAAFVIPGHQITSYWEFPAFALLGVTCAVVAICFQFALIGTDWVARNITMPLWARPVVGGCAVGTIALAYPAVVGVGYEATDAALKDQLPISMLLSLLIAKTAATAITLASRFGGGIFSPSLYLGAMAGGAFGLIAASVFPQMASSEGLYSILGMGAVAAAVLGAPVSTTMIVFELTGGYTLSIALLLTVSIATGITQAFHGRSYFHWQLAMHGVMATEGPHRFLSTSVKVRDFMDPPPEAEEDRTFSIETGGPYLHATSSLESALKTFNETGRDKLPVIDINDLETVIGIAHHVRALSYFNSALIEAAEEEHR